MTPNASEVAGSPAARLGRAWVWVGLVAIVSVAGAGLALSLDDAPTDLSRPEELTARGHALVAARLAALDGPLHQLGDAVDGLATDGRDVLAHLRALDTAATERSLAAGAGGETALRASLAGLTDARAGLLDGTSLGQLRAADAQRVTAIDAAIAAAGELPDAWLALDAATGTPMALLGLLDAHDAAVIAATDAGRAERYADALAALGSAGRELDRARASGLDAARRGLDVSTLGGWIVRAADYDAALTSLYALMLASGGVLTADARTALARVDEAQAVLPQDRSALVVIVTDLGAAPISDALLRIEAARGAVAAGIGTLD